MGQKNAKFSSALILKFQGKTLIDVEALAF